MQDINCIDWISFLLFVTIQSHNCINEHFLMKICIVRSRIMMRSE